MSIRDWWHWFKHERLRYHRLFYKPTSGQVETIKKMIEYCRENKIPYRHMLNTILYDYERVFNIKIDRNEIRKSKPRHDGVDDLPW